MTDWAVGDQAMCLFGGRWLSGSGREQPGGPKQFHIYEVVRVEVWEGERGIPDGLYLRFRQWDISYWSENFSKLEPLEPDPEELEVEITVRREIFEPQVASN